eukprot:NODE_2846_length_982_cov_61.166082_g2826_i0.p1 GENE.NODE_2846_length_982_cov_61.166082_g2826_i0~~NODE_2846_length_982_cov_61.166082_g2826_i0.p1  ORF type:complete len:201 (-),score=51.95 NODE_2846_length_982_cov_61.166082_g2826_i0:378-899(-)
MTLSTSWKKEFTEAFETDLTDTVHAIQNEGKLFNTVAYGERIPFGPANSSRTLSRDYGFYMAYHENWGVPYVNPKDTVCPCGKTGAACYQSNYKPPLIHRSCTLPPLPSAPRSTSSTDDSGSATTSRPSRPHVPPQQHSDSGGDGHHSGHTDEWERHSYNSGNIHVSIHTTHN